MKYNHIIINQLKGILTPPQNGVTEIVVDDRRGMRAVLTNQPDELNLEGDRRVVVAGLLLKGIFGLDDISAINKSVESGLEQLRESRRQHAGGCSFLVVTFTGEVEDFTPSQQRECENFIFTFDGPSTKPIREASEASIIAIIAAITLASESVIGVERVSDSVVFFRQDGKAIYAYAVSGGAASCYVSRPIAAEAGDLIKTWYPKLVGNSALERVMRLLTASFESEGDTLRSFLAAWTSLEIFVSKVFK